MTSLGWEFVPEDRQLIGRTVGELLAQLVRDRWPRNTAKHVARAWNIDTATATNLVRGHASERTITKALRAEGWEILEVLGFALTGLSHDEWLEQKLCKIIEEAERAQEGIRSLRARRDRLEARAAAVVASSDRKVSDERRTG